MSKINDGLDPNNEAHRIVIEINNQNESLYGPYNEREGLFEAFVRRKKPEYSIMKHMMRFRYDDMLQSFLAGGGDEPDFDGLLYDNCPNYADKKRSE